MPYKNAEDRAAWKLRNREKQRQYKFKYDHKPEKVQARLEAKQKRDAASKALHVEKVEERASKLKQQIRVAKCVECGSAFVAVTTTRTICSDECRNVRRIRAVSRCRKNKSVSKMRTHPCEACGDVFTTPFHSQRKCNSCRESHDKPVLGTEKKCVGCGTPFVVDCAARVYCSPDCRWRSFNKTRVVHSARKPSGRFAEKWRSCEECGGLFFYLKQGQPRYCSPECKHSGSCSKPPCDDSKLDVTCRKCGTQFASDNKNRTAFCVKCAAHRREIWNGWYRRKKGIDKGYAIRWTVCLNCSELFFCKGKGARRHCSEKCSNRFRGKPAAV